MLYLAMDYVDGVDLRELLRREGRLEPARAVGLVRQVGRGARRRARRRARPPRREARQHPRRGRADGERRTSATSASRGTSRRSAASPATAGFVGTVDYVAPEQIRGETVDGRADVYALGCVLFECLAGERPFERESELAVVFAHLNEPPPRLTELRPELPAAWDGVVARALAKEPASATRTCGALAAAADDALHGRAAPRRRVPRGCSRARPRRPSRSRPRAIGTVLAVRGDSPPRRRPVAAAARARRRRRDDRAATLASIRSGTRFGYGHAPPDVVVAGRSAWLLLPSEQRLLRVDTRTRELRARDQAAVGPARRGSPPATATSGPRRTAGPSSRASRRRPAGSTRFRPQNAPVDGARRRRRVALGRASDGRIARVVPGNGSSREPHPVRRQRADHVRRRRALVARGCRDVLRKLDPRTGRVLARSRPARHGQRRRGRRRPRLGGGRARRRRLRARRDRPACAAQARGRRRSGADLVRGAAGSGSRTAPPARSRRSTRARARAGASRSARRPTVGGVRRRRRLGGNRARAARRFRRPAGPELRLSLPGRLPDARPGASRTRRADEQLEDGDLREPARAIPTPPAPPGSGCAPRSRPPCRASPPTGARTPSASAAASASRRRRTSR